MGVFELLCYSEKRNDAELVWFTIERVALGINNKWNVPFVCLLLKSSDANLYPVIWFFCY